MKNDLSPQIIDALRDMQSIADAQKVPLLLVGAIARLLVFNRPFNILAHRETNDCDFAIRVESWDAFRRVCDSLTHNNVFQQRTPHRFVHIASEVLIDLVPFGGLEVDGAITWPDDRVMNMFGFQEAWEHACTVTVKENLKLAVATPPLLIALKFFAFADRGRTDDRDLRDIDHMFRHFPAAGREGELWESPLDSFVERADFDWGLAGCLLLGHDVGIACQTATVAKLTPIIRPLLDPYASAISRLVGHADEAERALTVQRLRWFDLGLRSTVA